VLASKRKGEAGRRSRQMLAKARMRLNDGPIVDKREPDYRHVTDNVSVAPQHKSGA
jgi:hypothetical protein